MKKQKNYLLFLLMLTAFTFFVLIQMSDEIKNETATTIEKKVQPKLYFEPNMGQFTQEIRYVMKGLNHSVFLSDQDLVMSINEQEKLLKTIPGMKLSERSIPKAWFRMSFTGSNNEVSLEGVNALSSRSNYFRGSDPEKWQTGIPHFEKAAYRNIYKGIDLVYYGNNNTLEYDFVIEPQADPGQIAMVFNGVDDLSIDHSGNLLLEINDQTIQHKKPISYQEIEGERHDVESQYVLGEDGQVSFELGDYDGSHALIIDPIISYSTYIGGLANDQGHDILSDNKGNIFISGMTGHDFPITEGSYDQINGPDEENVFDLYPAPNSLEFLHSSGSYSVASGNDVIDPVFGPPVTLTGNPPYPYDDDYAEVILPFSFPFQGQLYSSIFVNTDGNITFGAPQPSSNRIRHDMVFGPPRVAAFYADLAPIIFGIGNVHADVRADRVVVTWLDVPAFRGDYTAISDPITFQVILHANGDVQIIYDFIDEGFGAIVGLSEGYNPDGRQEIDLSMTDGSQTGNTVFEVFNYGATVFPDAFVMKFNKRNELVWSTYIGGDFVDSGFGISMDKRGDIVTHMITFSSDLPVFGSFGRGYSGGYYQWDSYVAKLSGNGDELLFGTYVGGSGMELPADVVVDHKNNIYISGVTTSTDFMDGETTMYDGAFPSQGGIQPYIVKLTNSGELVTYTHFPANGVIRYAYQRKGIMVTSNGNVVLAGNDDSGNVPVTSGAFQTEPGGGSDVFVAVLNSQLTRVERATYLGGSGNEVDSEFTLDESGNVYISAMTSSTDFPVTPNAYDKTYNGGPHDGFLAKISRGLNKLHYATYFGGSDADEPEAIFVHPSGEAFVAGLTHSDDFPLTNNAFDNTVVAGEAFMMRFNKKGSLLKFSTLFGGDGEDLPFGIALTPGKGHNGNKSYGPQGNDDKSFTLNVTGLTKSTNFPTTFDAFDSSYGNLDGWNDVFLTKFEFNADNEDEDKQPEVFQLLAQEDMSNDPAESKYSLERRIIPSGNSDYLYPQEKLKGMLYDEMYLHTAYDQKADETGIDGMSGNVILLNSYPNPFREVTRMEIELEDDAYVISTVHSLNGQLVAIIADSDYHTGRHVLQWDGKSSTGADMPNGIYMITLKTGNNIESAKVFLQR